MELPSGKDPKAAAEEMLRFKVKAELRKSIQRTRALLQASARKTKSEQIRDRVHASGVLQVAKSIALFRPIERKGEVDTGGLDSDARLAGLRVAYPAMERTDEGQVTMKMRWVEQLEGAFEERGFGFPEPSADAPEASPEDLDLVVVPGLAFDPEGHRLGYGAGFYDRFLPLCSRAKTLGVCFDFQLLAEIPTTAADVPVSMVVTEKRTLSR